MQLTDKQLRTLRHMLGINTPADSVPRPYRNYYAASACNEEMLELERVGAVELCGISHRRPPRMNLYYYRCTDAGKLEAMRSHRDIRYSRGRRRYVRYLDVSDAHAGLSFREFLTDPRYAEARRV